MNPEIVVGLGHGSFAAPLCSRKDEDSVENVERVREGLRQSSISLDRATDSKGKSS